MRISLIAVCNCLLMLTAEGIPSARPLGRCLGTFTVGSRAPLAKPSASAVYPLPPEGERQKAMASVSSTFDAGILDAYGWRVVNRYQGFAMLEGNAQSLPLLYEAPGIVEIHAARSVRPTMDAARRLSRVDGILNWGPRPNPAGVNGKGVLIGIVDYGFDTRHPAFLDSAGKTRFLAIWDPNLPKEKGAPYNMGRVRYQAQLQADTAFGNTDGELHGTHVASCAAGSDRTGPYYGVAPEAYLMGVNIATKNDSADFETNVANGIQWLFHEADSLKIPCVVNLSLGNAHFGPHDGTSMFDRFLDTLAAPGHIIVGAVGNSGNKSLHAGFNLGATDTLGTFSLLPALTDLWGEKNKPFKVEILIADSATGNFTVSSSYLSTATVRQRPVYDTLTWVNPVSGRTVFLALSFASERANAANGRPHAEFAVNATKQDAAADLLGLRIGFRLVGPGQVHAWNGDGTAFLSLGFQGFRDGDNDYSISEIGGTAKSIISVGGYVSKNEWADYQGKSHGELVDQKVGELAEWSSHGPTLDGRSKPELCAPGRVVVGALSSALTDPHDWQLPYIVSWPDPATRNGRYMAVEGTSQAAPVATGAVALMLELDPKLTGAQAKAKLMQSAYHDEFTGPLAAPNSLWGAGKLDASEAIQTIRSTPVAARGRKAETRPRVGLRWSQGILQVTGVDAAEFRDAGIYDWRGIRVADLLLVQAGRFRLSRELPQGVYSALLRTNRAIFRVRWLKD